MLETQDWQAKAKFNNIGTLTTNPPAYTPILTVDLGTTMANMDLTQTVQFRLTCRAKSGAAWTNNNDSYVGGTAVWPVQG